MSMRGQVQHNSAICSLPMNEHTGNEPCLEWVEEVDEIATKVAAHYAQGPQGNQVADYRADYLALYGPNCYKISLGSSGITDRRDNRDPEAVGTEILESRAIKRNGEIHAG